LSAIWRVPNSIHGGALDFDDDLSSLGLGSFGKFQSRSTSLSEAFADMLRSTFNTQASQSLRFGRERCNSLSVTLADLSFDRTTFVWRT
jgi:hypothetical protein